MASLLRLYLKRPEWLYFPGVELEPVKHFTFRPRLEPTAGDVALCGRLITSYQLACRERPPLETASALWKQAIGKQYASLSATVEAGDASALARNLAGMFQEPFLYGISSAHLGKDPGYSPFLRIRIPEEVLALAESLGLVRAETPEQGQLGYGFKEGLPKLVELIETDLGISMDFPKVGGAYGLEINGRLITPESSEHIYVAGRINDSIARYLPSDVQLAPRVVEIGAGFGGTAFWLHRLRHNAFRHYTIVDLPLMNICQGYFLAQSLGAEVVRLHGEPVNSQQRVSFIPPHARAQAIAEPFQLLINENAMPEMPESVVQEYLAWAKANLDGIFYSYNQEAFSPVQGTPQTLVPEVVSGLGGYKRLSRNYSWLRRGYVEEVYAIAH